MKTISFYSYKGGVGRSLALAYTAKYLAECNIGVCILDIDLEAPGVAYKFPEKSEIVLSKLGVVDYVHSCVTSDVAPDNIEEYFSTIYEKNKYGYVKLMSAGKDISKNEYWQKLSEINWNELFLGKNCEGLYIFENLKRQIEKQIKPEYLLIDSRTGITTIGKVCNSILPDKVVIFLANNAENFLGARMMYNHISNSADYKVNKTKSDIICAITRFPTDDDASVNSKKLTTFDMAKEADIIDKFLKIVDNPCLKQSDIFTIHSNRDVERNELLILQQKQFVRKEILERDYDKLINKFIDNDLLVERKILSKKRQKYRFIEFNLHETIENELKKYQDNMSYKEYRKKLEARLTESPNSCRLLYEHALCERYENNIIDAVRHLISTIDAAKDNDKWKIHARYLRGVIFLYDLYNYEESIKDLEIVYNAKNSFNLNICYDLALCYYCLGGLEKYPKAMDQAIEYIDRYISDNKQDYRAFLLRAAIYEEKKEQKEKIICDYNKAIDIKKDFVDSYHLRGHFYFGLGEIENALKDYDKAIEIDSSYKLENQNKFLYIHRGYVYFKLSKIENALKDYDKAIEIDPNYAEAYKNRGDIYLSLGKTKDAFYEYEKAYKINPNYKAAYDSLEKLRKPIAYYEALEITLHYNLQYDLYYDSGNIIAKYPFPIKYNRIDEYFELAQIKKDNRIILSDQGKTLKMLDKMFELGEYDVAKNLAAILKEFLVFKNGFDFSIEISNITIKDEEEKALNEAKYRLFRCVSFMNRMNILYEDYKCDKCGKRDGCDKFKINKFTLFNEAEYNNYSETECKDEFSFPIKYNNIDIEYKFALIKKDNRFFLSDLGNTYKMLDTVFELKEPDVQKNLSAIMKECLVSQDGNEFLVEIHSYEENMKSGENREINEAKFKLLECVSFMDTMRIFYV
ncbi:hypothetical protein R83H12_02464 [Fibrobacteria bacterium R8-3-H12]